MFWNDWSKSLRITCEGVHFCPKASNFIKSELLHRYFSKILTRTFLTCKSKQKRFTGHLYYQNTSYRLLQKWKQSEELTLQFPKEWPLLARKTLMYINFIVEFIFIIVSNITLYNIFRYIRPKIWSDWHKKMCQLGWLFFSIWTPNLEKFKCIINLSNAIDEFASNFYKTSTLKFISYCMKVGSSDFFAKKF